MNRPEFDQWTEGYFAAFPNTEAWVLRQPDARRTLELWFRVLEQFELEDCDRVTSAMFAGDLEPTGAFGEQETPRLVARYIRELQVADAAANAPEALQHKAYVPEEEFQIAPLLKKFTNRLRLGGSFTEALDAMRAAIPRMPSDREPRFRCLDCRDTGLIEVWSNEAMLAAKRGYLGRFNTLRTAVMVCGCFAGDKWAKSTIRKTDERYLLTFDAKKHLPCLSSDLTRLSPNRQERIDELTEFMRTYRAHEMELEDFASQYQ